MIDELQAVRRAFEAPAPDSDARDRALARLREAMEAERPAAAAVLRRPRVIHPAGWLGVAAAVVVMLLVIQATYWRHDSASSALHQLSSVASAQHALIIPAGQYVLVTAQDSQTSSQDSGVVGNQNIATGETFDLSVQRTIRTWLRPDGSGYRSTTVTGYSFPTSKDAQTWRDMTSPLPLPIVGEEDWTEFQRLELTSGLDLSRLPTDSAELLGALRPTVGGAMSDEQVMGRITDLLLYANPSPALRSALLGVLSDLPGIQFLGTVTDPLGRVGTGVVLPAGPDSKEVIFNPSTSGVLATLELATGDGAVRGWQAFTDPSIEAKGPPARSA